MDSKQCYVTGVPILVTSYSSRQDDEQAIISSLLAGKQSIVAITDEEGHCEHENVYFTGKSSMATAICRMSPIQEHFRGIVWLDMKSIDCSNDSDSLLASLVEISSVLAASLQLSKESIVGDMFNSVESCVHSIRYLASQAQAKILLVLDDLRDALQVGKFIYLGCSVLITSRSRVLIERTCTGVASIRALKTMSEKNASEIISRTIGATDVSGSWHRAVMQYSLGCPLLIALASQFKGYLKDYIASNWISSTPSPRKHHQRTNRKSPAIENLDVIWNILTVSNIFTSVVKVLILLPVMKPIPFDLLCALLLGLSGNSPVDKSAIDPVAAVRSLQFAGIISITEVEKGLVDAMVVVNRRVEMSLRQWYWQIVSDSKKEFLPTAPDIKSAASILSNWTMTLCNHSVEESIHMEHYIVDCWRHLSSSWSTLQSSVFEGNGTYGTALPYIIMELYDSALARCESTSKSTRTAAARLFPRSSILMTAHQRPIADDVFLSADTSIDPVFMNQKSTYSVPVMQSESASKFISAVKICLRVVISVNSIDTTMKGGQVLRTWAVAWLRRTEAILNKMMHAGLLSKLDVLESMAELGSVLQLVGRGNIAILHIDAYYNEMKFMLLDSGITGNELLLRHFCQVAFGCALQLNSRGDYAASSELFKECLHFIENNEFSKDPEYVDLENFSFRLGALDFKFWLLLPLHLARVFTKLERVKEAKSILQRYDKLLDLWIDSKKESIVCRTSLQYLKNNYLFELGRLQRAVNQPNKSINCLRMGLAECTSSVGLAFRNSHPYTVSFMFELCRSILNSQTADKATSGSAIATAAVLISDVMELTPLYIGPSSLEFLERVVVSYRLLLKLNQLKPARDLLLHYMALVNDCIEGMLRKHHLMRCLLGPPDDKIHEHQWSLSGVGAEIWVDFVQFRQCKLIASFLARVLGELYVASGDFNNARTILYRGLLVHSGDIESDSAFRIYCIQNGIFAPFEELAETYLAHANLCYSDKDFGKVIESIQSSAISRLNAAVLRHKANYQANDEADAVSLTVRCASCQEWDALTTLFEFLEFLRQPDIIDDIDSIKQLQLLLLAHVEHHYQQFVQYWPRENPQDKQWLLQTMNCMIVELLSMLSVSAESLGLMDEAISHRMVALAMISTISKSSAEDEGVNDDLKQYHRNSVFDLTTKPLPLSQSAIDCGIDSDDESSVASNAFDLPTEAVISESFTMTRESLMSQLETNFDLLREYNPSPEQRQLKELHRRVSQYLLKE